MPICFLPGSDMSPQTNRKPALGQRSTSKKHGTSISCTPEPAIWSCDTSQQIPCFDRCQLIITWMSNIKEANGKPRLHVSVNLLLGTFRWEDEDDYEYEFSAMSMRITFRGQHFSKCACSEKKTRTRGRSRPPI